MRLLELLIALDRGNGNEIGVFRQGDVETIYDFMKRFGFVREDSERVAKWSVFAPVNAQYQCGDVWATIMEDQE